MSQLEAKIVKATDAVLTGDNWEYILEVCDTISMNPETNTKIAIKEIKNRLGKKDANIVLRTLSLLVAVGENCGSRMQQEIASTEFLKECLLSKLADRKLHPSLKQRIFEVLEQLATSFKKDPSLKAIDEALQTARARYRQYSKAPPAKPGKKELTGNELLKEEQEIQRALRLSTEEYEREQNVRRSYLKSKPLPEANPSSNTPEGASEMHSSPISSLEGARVPDHSVKPIMSIANVKKVRALYDLISYEPDELSFRKGDVITVVESVYRDWWKGITSNGKSGIFPLNYVVPVLPKSPEERKNEEEFENAIIANESRKVDKLLSLLSSNDQSSSEEEITELYNELVPLKPILAKLIEKHSTRRDELDALDSQAKNQVKSYNDLIDGVVSSRRLSQQHQLPYPYHGSASSGNMELHDWKIQH